MASATPPDSAPSTPPRRKHERWWWLALTLVVSLLLHVGIGWESRGWRLLGLTMPTAATPPPGEVEVDFSAEPNQPNSKPANNPVRTALRLAMPRTAAPRFHPIREAPHKPDPHPTPAQPPPPHPAPTAAANNNGGRAGSLEPPPATPMPRRLTLTLPPKRATPSPQPPATVVAIVPAPAPTALATPGLPTAPNTKPALPDKLGTPDKPDKKVAETPPQHAPAPPPVPASGATPDKNGATTAPTAAPKIAAVPNTAPAAPTGSSVHEPEGAPIAGGSARIGISRGIPFGGRTGLSGRLPPGEGIGPDGQPTGVRSGYDSKGVFHVHIAKPTAASLGLTPARIVYVLDVSGSMNDDNKIGLARAALRDAVNELLPDDKFTFVTFSEHPTAYSKTLLPATPFGISTLETNVDLVEPNGGTDLSDALDLALGMTGVRNIFLISDGEPNIGISKPDALSAHLKDVNSGAAVHITVFALGAGEQFEGVKLLRRIADENAGEYRYINDKEHYDR